LFVCLLAYLLYVSVAVLCYIGRRSPGSVVGKKERKATSFGPLVHLGIHSVTMEKSEARYVLLIAI
jgi:hypothetical protein